jgi:hypothetical protein
MAANCYLCGSTENLTRDHIPPKGFFTPDSKANLITVPCCKACNASYSKDDEAMRAWLTSSVFTSQQGRWIFQNKVLRSFKHKPHLSRSLFKELGSAKALTKLGELKGSVQGMPTDRANRFVIRICKGIIRHTVPDFDYSTVHFAVRYLLPTQEARSFLRGVLPHFQYNSRGDTVFRYWFGLANDTPVGGMMTQIYYHGACFMVFFGPAENFARRPPAVGPVDP